MGKFFSEEVLDVNSSTSVGLTPAKYDNSGSSRATKATIQIGSTPIYYSFGDEEPSATNGFVAVVGDIVELSDFDNIKQVKIIAQSGSGSVYVAYES